MLSIHSYLVIIFINQVYFFGKNHSIAVTEILKDFCLAPISWSSGNRPSAWIEHARTAHRSPRKSDRKVTGKSTVTGFTYLLFLLRQWVQWVRRNLQQLAALWVQSPSGWDTVLTTCLQSAFRKHLRLILLCTGAQPTEKEGMWGNTFPTKRMFAAKHYSTAPFSLQNIASCPGWVLCFPRVKGFNLRHFINSVSSGAQTKRVPFYLKGPLSPQKVTCQWQPLVWRPAPSEELGWTKSQI